MKLDKRISELEKSVSEKHKPRFASLAELYEWENSPEGQEEREYLLYNPNGLPCSLREAMELYRIGGKAEVEKLRKHTT